MARVEETDVREIIDLNGETPSMAAFIVSANTLTDKVSAADTLNELNDATLKEIERYLAAYFAEHLHQQYSSESEDGASSTFMGQTGMGLKQNKWGQTAIMLDTTGFLADIAEGVTSVGTEWGGLPPSEQTDYRDRD